MVENNSIGKPGDDHPVRKKGVIATALDLIFKIIGVLIFSAVISVIIEWIGMMFFYPDQGFQHAQYMMKQEIVYLGQSLDGDSVNADAVTQASIIVDQVVSFLFIDSGVFDSLNAARKVTEQDGRFMALFKGLFAEYYDFLMAAIFIIVMFLIRLAILILSLPVFLLFGFVGLSDGLMQRDLRRWCGGNESGFIYHWAKKFALPVLITSWIIYLAIPASIHPNYIITPFAVLFGLTLLVMASKFKKYL